MPDGKEIRVKSKDLKEVFYILLHHLLDYLLPETPQREEFEKRLISLLPDLRVASMGDSFGTHCCQFYEAKEDLIDTLVSHFAEGLRNNELCMWVTAPPLSVEEAKAALQKAVPDLEQYIGEGQIEILPHTDWYLLGGLFDGDRVLRGWLEKERSALNRGFAGLRIAGNVHRFEGDLWEDLLDYEAAVNSVFAKHRIKAVCMYSLERCTGSDVVDVLSVHQSVLFKAWRLEAPKDIFTV